MKIGTPFTPQATKVLMLGGGELGKEVVIELQRLGVEIEEFQDGLRIQPTTEMQPAEIETYDDHRMAMSFTLVGLKRAGIKIKNPACVNKTFPRYFQVLSQLVAG